MHTDHDAPNADVNPEALKQGFEPDSLHVRMILYVPVAILITAGLAYIVVTFIVNGLRHAAPGPDSKLPAAVYNDKTVDQRLARIKDPRLDGLQELEHGKMPPWVQSRPSTPTGNSPDYHIDDMWPWSRHGMELGLLSYHWSDQGKDTVRIPIMEAIKILGDGADDKDPAAKKLYEKTLKSDNKVDLKKVNANRPTASNPQQGAYPAAPAAPEPSKKEGH